jgi:hypothetical protein
MIDAFRPFPWRVESVQTLLHGDVAAKSMNDPHRESFMVITRHCQLCTGLHYVSPVRLPSQEALLSTVHPPLRQYID